MRKKELQRQLTLRSLEVMLVDMQLVNVLYPKEFTAAIQDTELAKQAFDNIRDPFEISCSISPFSSSSPGLNIASHFRSFHCMLGSIRLSVRPLSIDLLMLLTFAKIFLANLVRIFVF